MRLKFIKVQDFSKKNSLGETYGSTASPLLEWVLEWCPLTPVTQEPQKIN